MLPQIILVSFYMLSLGCALVKHGEQSRINFGTSFISIVIIFGLLFWGGFFS